MKNTNGRPEEYRERLLGIGIKGQTYQKII
jgi:hypothetical protein